MSRSARAICALLGAALLLAAAPAQAATHEWHLTVASWNLLNFGDNKAAPGGVERVNLLTRMGAIAGAYDILIFQEVLQGGGSVTAHLVNYLPAGYQCANVSQPSGRVGRQESYVVCAPPANAWGTIAVTGWTDYAATGANYTAANGTMRPAANVWMRPPAIATITFTPTDVTLNPVVFGIYTNHTKPAYGASAHARPPGTVAGAPNNSSVHYELRAIEQNLAAGANKMLIGDLNADCVSYPARDRGLDFAAGWAWYVNYGERTNTAVGSTCGYDRILLNTALNGYYEAHGVDYDHYGNATRVDAARISDHYPVWVRLGQVVVAAPKAKVRASTDVPVTETNKRRKFATTDTVKATGVGLKPLALGAKFFVVPYTTTMNFKSNFTYALTDVRGAPTPVTTDANGNLNQTVSWAQPPEGAYVFVFDANGDGKFSLRDGDFANQAVEADIYVTQGTAGHNNLVTMGDNILLRDVFDLDQAYNVYALAKNLPASATGNLYVVSQKLLRADGYTTWDKARQARIDLAKYAIPINLADRSLIDTSKLTAADKQTPFTATPTGELFLSAWSRPAQLMNATVNYVAPPGSVYKPEFAGSGDPPDSPNDFNAVDDPCELAYVSAVADFTSACNVGFGFSNYYGNAFNLVLDVGGDGKLGPNDPVDIRDIGDMSTYFGRSGVTTLGPNADGDPAVSEYKEYLSRALSVPLSANNTYDNDTKIASSRYTCGDTLSKQAFQTWIVSDSQTGFRVLESGAYQSRRTATSGIYQYDSAFLNGVAADDADVCISGQGDLSYGGDITVQDGANVTSVAQTHRFENVTVQSDNSTTCFMATESVAGASLLFGAATAIETGGLGLVVGLVGYVGAKATQVFTCGI